MQKLQISIAEYPGIIWKKLFKVEAFNYALWGFLFGCFFPLAGTFMEARSLSGANGLSQFIAVQKNTPLLWIIDTAPFFLGLSAYLIGNRIDVLRQKNREILEIQEQLILREQMASIGKVTAGIAHEIKNPLNFVSNFAEGSAEVAGELAEELDRHREKFTAEELDYLRELINELRQNAGDIKKNADRATRIMFTLMDINRGGEGPDIAVDINALLDENINLAYHGYRANYPDFNMDIKKSYDQSLPVLWLNGNSLGRVLLNLLDNACYALYQKQKTTSCDFLPTLTVSTQWENGRLQICIKDNGPGISEGVGQKIFDPFFTTKPSGEGNTGLGLSLSKDIVEKEHKGRIQFESQEGQYTQFMLQIPIRTLDPNNN